MYMATPKLSAGRQAQTVPGGCSMTGAATWKLRLWSSVAVVSKARSPRPAEWRPARPMKFAVAMCYGSMQDRSLFGHS